MSTLLAGEIITCPTAIRRVCTWVWSRTWARRSAIVALVWHVVGAVMMMLAPVASAADTQATGSVTNILGWMQIKDSSGINAASYYLSIDQGGPTHPIKAIWAFITTFEYEAYRGIVLIAIWIIKQALSFQWLQLIVAPISHVGSAVSVLTDKVHLGPLMLSLAGGAVALWMLRGRYSTGIYELLVSAFIAAGVFGFLAHPVSSLAGDNGAIMKTANLSLEVANGLSHDGATGSTGNSEQVDDMTSKLTDTFIRQPTQLLNFGVVLDKKNDGGDCKKWFDGAYLGPKSQQSGAQKLREDITSVPIVGGVLDDITPGSNNDPNAHVREAVAKCKDGDKLKNYADNPSPEPAIAAILLIPAAGLIFLFAIYLAGRVVLAAVWALFNGVKLIPGGVLGIAPMFRGQLLRSLADVAMALLQVAFAIIFIAAYIIVITSLFDDTGATLMATVLIVDCMLAIALWMFRKGMIGLHKWSDRLAEIMARRPGASPVSVKPQRGAASAQDLVARAQAARGAYHGVKKVASTAGKVLSKSGQAAAAVGTGGASTAASTAVTAAKVASTAKTAKDVATTAKNVVTPRNDGESGGPTTGAPVGGGPTPTPQTPSAGAAPQPTTPAKPPSTVLMTALDRGRSRNAHGEPAVTSSATPPVATGRASQPRAKRAPLGQPRTLDEVRRGATVHRDKGGRRVVTPAAGKPTPTRPNPSRPQTPAAAASAKGKGSGPAQTRDVVVRRAGQRSGAETSGPRPVKLS